MVTFSDIINFQYGETEVDKDICHLLQTDEFKPAYADITREFLVPEIANCQQAVNDENHLLTVREQNTMSEDNLTRDEKELSEALDWLDFSSDKREFWHNYFTNPTHGRQKAPPLCVLQNNNKKYITMPFGLTKDAFYTTYTEIHELMHGVQAKYFNPIATRNFYKDHYELLYQGKSRDEALAIQTANNPELVKQRHYERCFKEMQANSAATCYMMLQACRTEDKSIIDKVEQRLLNESAAMSGALMNESLGLAYFEYPATKKIIEDVKSGKCDNLLNDKGLLEWKTLYNYTKTKVDEMGYNKDDMYESLQTAKLLKGLRAKHPDNKEVFLQEVEKLAPTLKAPHNKIFSQFTEAQRNYVPEKSGMLNFFYFRLANKDTRDEVLAKFDNQSIPNIEKYRQLHQESKRTYFKMPEQARDNITRKANLTLDIPKTGYNFRATNYVSSKIADGIEDCGFLDTTDWLIAASEDADKSDDLAIDACGCSKMITGELTIAPDKEYYNELQHLLKFPAYCLTNDEIPLQRLVAPITIASDNKEAHGVALCIDSHKDKNAVDIMILEQHAMRDKGNLDYSQEIDSTLSVLKGWFENLGVDVNTFQNEKPICREKGVCGIVSTEVCRRLLESENPMKTAQLGTIKINAEQVQQLHKANFLNYQKDNPPNINTLQRNLSTIEK